jgi:hypothetical protein
MLYYRKDLVPTPPKTWDEMMSMCSIAKKNNMDCYAGQFAKYEGLTGERGRGDQHRRRQDRRRRRQDPRVNSPGVGQGA